MLYWELECLCTVTLCCPLQLNMYELQKSTFLVFKVFHYLEKLCAKELIEINDFCRAELLEQTQVSRRYESRAKDLKTLLDSSNDKLQVHFTLDPEIFTVRNSSCEKVMFSQVSVCPQEGGVHAPSPGRQTPLPDRQTPPRQTPPRDGYYSGRYASYWNAFLLSEIFSCVPLLTKSL